MRSRQGARRPVAGLAVVMLLAGACSTPFGTDDAAPRDLRPPTTQLGSTAALAATGRELPPPPSTDGLTVLVTSVEGVDAPGLDAAVTTLQQRPDLHIDVAAPGRSGEATTMSGVPVDRLADDGPGVVTAALDGSDPSPDLVIVGIVTTRGPAASDAAAAAATARAAVGHGTPALVVAVERTGAPDYAAASMELLDVLDFELQALLDGPPAAFRLTVPSCLDGMLRGRVTTTPTSDAPPDGGRSDCISPEPPTDAGELELFRAGFAVLAELP